VVNNRDAEDPAFLACWRSSSSAASIFGAQNLNLKMAGKEFTVASHNSWLEEVKGEDIVVDRFVVCLHPQLGVWARGQVVSVRELEVDLWMVDYAGLVRLPSNSLRRLLPDFCHLPAFVEILQAPAHETRIVEPNQQGKWVRVGARSLKEYTRDVRSTESVINLQLRDFLLSSIIKESNCDSLVTG